MQCSAKGGVLMFQVIYRILHAVQCYWRCINGSSDVQITACSVVLLEVYWCFKWYREYCMQYSATGGVLMVQVILQITACSAVQLAVYWWFKWCTDYCMQCSATGSVLMVQMMYRLLRALQCNWRCIDGSSDVQNTACSTVQLAVYWWFKWCTDYCM